MGGRVVTDWGTLLAAPTLAPRSQRTRPSPSIKCLPRVMTLVGDDMGVYGGSIEDEEGRERERTRKTTEGYDA